MKDFEFLLNNYYDINKFLKSARTLRRLNGPTHLLQNYTKFFGSQIGRESQVEIKTGCERNPNLLWTPTKYQFPKI